MDHFLRVAWKSEWLSVLTSAGLRQTLAHAEFAKRYGKGGKIDMTLDAKQEAKKWLDSKGFITFS